MNYHRITHGVVGQMRTLIHSGFAETYFKHATEIGTGVSAEGQIVTKAPFSTVLKRFPPVFFSVVYRNYLLNKYMVTTYGSHEYLHFNLNAWNLKNKWIVIYLFLTMESKR